MQRGLQRVEGRDHIIALNALTHHGERVADYAHDGLHVYGLTLKLPRGGAPVQLLLQI